MMWKKDGIQLCSITEEFSIGSQTWHLWFQTQAKAETESEIPT